MADLETLTLEEKMRITLEMADVGFEMMRMNLRRRFPQENDEQIERRLHAWLDRRPGAEHGDGWGVPGKWTFLPDPPAGATA